MTETTKLIQELVGLAVEKDIDFAFDPDQSRFFVFYDDIKKLYTTSVYIKEQDAQAKLQAAIDKVKGL